MAKVITPGGRIGDDRKRGSRANGENWVERTKKGSLPRYIRIVRNGMMKDGMSESRATAMAVSAIKRWAKGGGDVSPKVRAAALKALAEWNAMKGEKSLRVSEQDSVAGTGYNLVPSELDANETKGHAMKMEFKEVGVSGVTVVDEEKGIVETIVSVTGIVDNVKDVIHPGSYEKTLQTRNPKGVWSHKWEKPVSRTLDVKELMPGDPELPKKMPNGSPWPAAAGALKIKTQFNLDTQRGREAYSDVIFFGDEQEWSIGYQVPVGGAKIDSKTGQRHITYLELYEYSPVLFGAMSSARTITSVKDAQIAHREINMSATEFKSWLDDHGLEWKTKWEDGSHESVISEFKSAIAGEEDEDDFGDDLFDFSDDIEEGSETKAFQSFDRETLVRTRDAIDDYLYGNPEFKGADGKSKSVLGCVKKYRDELGDDFDVFTEAAAAFDAAYEDGDEVALEEAGENLLSIIEEGDADDDVYADIAAVIARMAGADDAPVDGDDVEKKGGSVPGDRKNGRARYHDLDDEDENELDDEDEDDDDDPEVESKSEPIVMEAKAFHDMFNEVFAR